jgi:exopolyphosphatase/guanosine-5'-triphosphate,3'-diphosphate pyrophosphatase
MADGSRHGAIDPSPPRAADGTVFAALDLGTNNCRMLVAKAISSGAVANAVEPRRLASGDAAYDFRVIDSFSRITRLGEGVSATGRLSGQAMDRTIDALKRAKPVFISRSSPLTKKRRSRSRAAPRCSTVRCLTPSSSISAAAPPKSCSCASTTSRS